MGLAGHRIGVVDRPNVSRRDGGIATDAAVPRNAEDGPRADRSRRAPRPSNSEVSGQRRQLTIGRSASRRTDLAHSEQRGARDPHRCRGLWRGDAANRSVRDSGGVGGRSRISASRRDRCRAALAGARAMHAAVTVAATASARVPTHAARAALPSPAMTTCGRTADTAPAADRCGRCRHRTTCAGTRAPLSLAGAPTARCPTVRRLMAERAAARQSATAA